jgi:LmbE family N-acetylglucosaminyl deacetylase
MSSFVSLTAADRVLVLAPHPDDESLGAGGLLAHAVTTGARARVLFATDGDNAPWIQRVAERRWRIADDDRHRFGARRRTEATAALSELGLPSSAAIFLGRRDQGLTADVMRGDDQIIGRLAHEFRRWQPTVLVVPSLRDLHPDHSALAVLARFALDRLDSAHAPRQVLTYLIHGLRRWSAAPLTMRLTPEEQRRKRAAISCHASQLSVHRRAYLRMARDIERYGSECDGPPHPIRRLDVVGSELQFAIAPQPRAGAFGRTRIFLVAQRGGARETLTFPLRHGRTLLARPLAGDRVGEVHIERTGAARAVRMQFDGLASAERLFAKPERRFGFFDEAGWIDVSRLNGTPDHNGERAPDLNGAPDLEVQGTRSGRRIVVVMPCFNVATYCGDVVRGLLAYEHVRIIAIDDGSTDGTEQRLRAAAPENRLILLRFPQNRGKGVALIEAFRHALTHVPFDVLVTIDGDGQHRPGDLPALVEAWRDGADLVIGERPLADMAPRRRWGNDFMGALVRSIYPACPTDSQSGYRAFDRTLVQSIVGRVSGARYETELRMLLLALAEGRRLAAVPIPTLYLDGNRSSHYRPFADSIRIWIALTEACYLDRWTDRQAWRVFTRAIRKVLRPSPIRDASAS